MTDIAPLRTGPLRQVLAHAPQLDCERLCSVTSMRALLDTMPANRSDRSDLYFVIDGASVDNACAILRGFIACCV